jgi:hypothetical protein
VHGDEDFLADVLEIGVTYAEVPKDAEDIGSVLIEDLSRGETRGTHWLPGAVSGARGAGRTTLVSQSLGAR